MVHRNQQSFRQPRNLASRRGTSGFHLYEQRKQAWIARHPEATPREYEREMIAIAKRCGV